MRRAYPWSGHRPRASEPRTSRPWLARPPEQTRRDRGRRAGPSHRGNFCALARWVIGDWRYHSFYIASWSYGLAIARRQGPRGWGPQRTTAPARPRATRARLLRIKCGAWLTVLQA